MGDGQRYVGFEELGALGVVQEVNRQLLHPMGLALERVSDGTMRVIEDPDPEGWQFGGFPLRPGAVAFAERQAEWHARRLAALGYVVQPVEEECEACAAGNHEACRREGGYLDDEDNRLRCGCHLAGHGEGPTAAAGDVAD